MRSIQILRAWYDSDNELIMLLLDNSWTIGFPAKWGQETSILSNEELSKVVVGPGRDSIYWEDSGAGFELESILQGRFGSQKWMEKLNRKLGRHD